MDPLLVTVVVLTLLFAFSNGFHDTSSAVANAVSTRALTPFIALLLATVFNFIGGLIGQAIGQGVTERVGNGIVGVPPGSDLLLPLLAAAVLAALIWNVATWWFALPSSSTHALVGGLLGAGLVLGAVTHFEALFTGVLLPLFLAPVTGFVCSFAVTFVVIRVLARSAPAPLFFGARSAQAFSTAALAIAHGVQDAQKSTAIIALALSAGYANGLADASWTLRIIVALTLAAGTYAGGWRIVRTLGERLTVLDPVRGLVSDTVSAAILYVGAFALATPLSMTYVVTSSIAGAGVTGRRRAVNPRVLAPIAVTWLISLPATALIAAPLALLFTLG